MAAIMASIPNDSVAPPGSSAEPPGIERLSPDLLQCILEYLTLTRISDSSPSTIPALLLTSKAFHASACLFTNRSLTFHFCDSRTRDNGTIARDSIANSRRSAKLLKTLLKDASKRYILVGLRHVTIEAARFETYGINNDNNLPLSNEELKKKWRDVVQLLKRCAHLKTLTWQGTEQLPLVLLDALREHQPQAHLHVKNWHRLDDDDNHEVAAEIALAKSPNLRSIQAGFWNTNVACDLRFAALRRIVALSPHLESVDVSQERSGCVVVSYPIETTQEQPRLAEKFRDEKPSKNAIKSLISAGCHLTEFMDDTDFSKLENFDIRCFFFPFTAEQLPNLKSLAVVLNRNIDATPGFQPFLLSIKPLESLKLQYLGPASDFDINLVLKYHGPNLRVLSLHKEETPSLSQPRVAVTPSRLHEINRLCPHLQDLTIDVDRSETGEPELKVLAALAECQTLEVARIYFDLGIAKQAHSLYQNQPSAQSPEQSTTGPNTIVNPFKTLRAPEYAWAVLQHEREVKRAKEIEMGATVAKTKRIKELHVKIGEWERKMGLGYPAVWVLWEQSHKRYCVLSPSERDDRPGEMQISINKVGAKTKTVTEKVPDWRDVGFGGVPGEAGARK